MNGFYLYLRSFLGGNFPSNDCFPRAIPELTSECGVVNFSSLLSACVELSVGPGCPGRTPCLEFVREWDMVGFDL